ncbi:hypothetical protein HJFPF1_04705 [Paramyrothecium foliicola]|nr:hypothetical protein HJFPF1_04705 [Paramyrothecium foliicola]
MRQSFALTSSLKRAWPTMFNRNLLEPAYAGPSRRDLENNADSELTRSEKPGAVTLTTSATTPLPSDNIILSLLRRFFDTFPFLAEIWYWNLSYWVYQLLRALSAVLIAGNKAVFLRAQNHALQILRAEQVLGIAIELPLQRYVLSRLTWLVPYLANVYYSHICVGICFIIYTYTYLPPSLFRRIRRTIAVDNAIALVIVTLWRCSPPRLLPAEHGFVDVLHGGGKSVGAASVWTHNRFQLTIAAMPSLHFGTALFLAVCLCRFSPHRWLRMVAPLWPAAMLFTILSTGNHFITDALVGSMVPLIGWRYNHVVLVFKPIEDWLFAPFRRTSKHARLPSIGTLKSLID